MMGRILLSLRAANSGSEGGLTVLATGSLRWPALDFFDLPMMYVYAVVNEIDEKLNCDVNEL